ncbi:MAG: hypothetical protein KDA61_07060 [Planctomycetales bacterium]|nr:hypothetical protein [Planctomycetales bacterium]
MSHSIRWTLYGALAACCAVASATVRADGPPPMLVPLPPVDAEEIPAPPPAPLPRPESPDELYPAVESTGSTCEMCGQGSTSCCEACRNTTRLGRLLRGIHRGLCCPDPCYNPKWTPLADAAFFTTAVRPTNQQRFRWDFAEDLNQPDRAEFFWARADGNGAGPNPNPQIAFRGVDYDELTHYVEAAQGAVGVWFEYSYRSLDADGRHFAGFGDMTTGAKTLLFDTELMQFAFQMKTFIPQGSPGKGLGTGHVSLEPGFVWGLRLSDRAFMQAELNEWIPLGGNDVYAGALLRYNVALNRELFRLPSGVLIMGVGELNGWRFQDGMFTDPTLGALRPASGDTYLNTGGGVRMYFCDRADFGVSGSFAITDEAWAQSTVRTEIRFRY